MVATKAKKRVARPAGNTQDVASCTAPASPALVITNLLVKELQPSGWNPNWMSDEAFAAFRDDVQSRGKLPKPVVVVRKESHYEIVDGEHGWRAAKECGLTEIPCEIIDVDPFEAMRQTIVRNRHGESNPLLLGRLYQRMLQESQMSNRQLAAVLCIAEGTIRNHLDYVKAAEFRTPYVPADAADQQIGRLTVKQVTTYLGLPDDKRDEWLDSGANLNDAAQLMPEKAEAKPDAGNEPAVPADELNDDADADSELPGDADTPESPGLPTPPTAPTPHTTTHDEEETFDQNILGKLEDEWKRANKATQQRFLAGALSDPDMLAIARRMINRGS